MESSTDRHSPTVAARVRALDAWLEEQGSVAVGYSGGVDSTFLAVRAAHRLGPERVLALLGVSASLASHVHARARSIARQFGVRFRELPTRELDSDAYVANAGDRCFHCKSELWSRIVPFARSEGYSVVIDGTIADDLGDDRPGWVAGRAAGVQSPLADCGFTKDDVRSAARALGIPNWDAPASPCLASRIATGLAVTPDRLARIERAEHALRELGLQGDLRVRDTRRGARIELAPAQLEQVQGAHAAANVVDAVVRAGFESATLDPRGYRRGGARELTVVDA